MLLKHFQINTEYTFAQIIAHQSFGIVDNLWHLFKRKWTISIFMKAPKI